MDKIKEIEVYLSAENGNRYSYTDGMQNCYTTLSKQKGFFLTKEQLTELLGNAFDAASKPREGKTFVDFNRPHFKNKEQFIKTII